MSRVERAEAREERIAKQAETDMQQAQAVKVTRKKRIKAAVALHC